MKFNIKQFEDALISLGDFKTIEEFWMIYSHLKRSDDLPPCDIFLFKVFLFKIKNRVELDLLGKIQQMKVEVE